MSEGGWQAGPAGQTEGADAHGRREAGADARAPNGQGKGGIRGRWGTRLIGGPSLSVSGERDVAGEAGRGLGCSWASACGGRLGRAGGAGRGVREKEGTGWAVSV